MISHQEYLSRKYLPTLDVLRAVSVLLVVTVHLKGGPLKWLGGELGVTIFFVLSGYLITFLALREERETGRLNLPAFYVRRTFRIFPAYYFTLGVYAVLLLVLRVKPDSIINFLHTLPFQAVYLGEVPFFLGIDGSRDIPFYHSWSLGIEEKFYLAWPGVAFVLLRSLKHWRLPVCLTMLLFLAFVPQRLGVYGGLLFPYFHIMVGCAIALVLDDRRRFEILSGASSLLLPFTAALVVAHFAWTTLQSFPHDGPIDAIYGLLVGCLLVSILMRGERLDKQIAHPALVEIGRLSYLIYLLHILCINVADVAISKIGLGNQFSVAANLVVSLALSMSVAWLLSKFLERPMIVVGRWISNRIVRSPVLEPA